MKSSGILVLIVVATFLFSCNPEEIVLHGNIKGTVTDALTNDPIPNASVILTQSNDTCQTGIDGTYLFKNLQPGDYEIKVLKNSYEPGTKNVKVVPEETQTTDLSLTGIPVPDHSVSFLDFKFDLTSLSFSITNIAKGKFKYSITPSQDWIIITPYIGEVSSENDIIKVTINKTGLSEKKHIERIEIVSDIGRVLVRDTIQILVNGVMDPDKNYYGTVTIGTQHGLQKT